MYNNLVQELRLDSQCHKQYLRMAPANFDHIIALIGPSITKQDTNMRLALTPGLNLAVTLHHLAEGAGHMAI